MQWLSKLYVESFDYRRCLGPAVGATGGELSHDPTDVAYRIVRFPSFRSIKLCCLWLCTQSVNNTS